MNEFPQFQPNQPALEQLSASKLNLVSQGQKSNQIQPGVGYRVTQTLGGTTVSRVRQRQATYQHPWKVTANGDDTVRVGEGMIHSFLDGISGGLASLSMAQFADFEGGDVTVLGTGVIYGTIPAALSLQPILDISAEVTDSASDTHTEALTLMRVFPDTSIPISVGFAASVPVPEFNTDFYWEIARVELEDGIAVITKQILRHDPMLWSFYPPNP